MQATRITATQQLRENGVASAMEDAMVMGDGTYAGYKAVKETVDDVTVYRLYDGHNRLLATGSKLFVSAEWGKLLNPTV